MTPPMSNPGLRPSPALDEEVVALIKAIDAEMAGVRFGYADVRGELLFRAREALALLQSAPQHPADPVAWKYELATYGAKSRQYGGWVWQLTSKKPNVPEGSLRNLTPLYASPQPADPEEVARLREAADEALKAMRNSFQSWPDVERKLAAALNTPPAPVDIPPSREEETGWLIEAWDSKRGEFKAEWWGLGTDDEDGFGWTKDSLRALRFGRECDAQAYITETGWSEAKPTEHRWGAPPQQPADPGEVARLIAEWKAQDVRRSDALGPDWLDDVFEAGEALSNALYRFNLNTPPAPVEPVTWARGPKTEATIERDGFFINLHWIVKGGGHWRRIYEPQLMDLSPALADVLALACEAHPDRALPSPPAAEASEPLDIAARFVKDLAAMPVDQILQLPRCEACGTLAPDTFGPTCSRPDCPHKPAAEASEGVETLTNDEWYAEVNQGRRGPPHPTHEQITEMRRALRARGQS